MPNCGQKGDLTLNERMKMLTAHRESLNEQIKVLQEHMAKLDDKIDFYRLMYLGEIG